MIPVPTQSTDPGVQALRRLENEVYTALTGTALVLVSNVVDGYLMVFKNGLLLTPGVDYTFAGGNTVTLTAALMNTDQVNVWYWTRAS